MENVIPDSFKKYRVLGLPADSPELTQIKADFLQAGLPLNAFITHPLKLGFEIIDLPQDVNEIKLYRKNTTGVQTIEPTIEQKALLKRALDLVNVKALDDINLKNVIMQKWNEYPILKQVLKWWNNIDQYFTITPAGLALANAFTHGRDVRVPKIN